MIGEKTTCFGSELGKTHSHKAVQFFWYLEFVGPRLGGGTQQAQVSASENIIWKGRKCWYTAFSPFLVVFKQDILHTFNEIRNFEIKFVIIQFPNFV